MDSWWGRLTTTDRAQNRGPLKIIVAVDFGTTFSGLAYANTWEPNDQSLVEDWGDNVPSGQKVPTLLRQKRGGTTDQFDWGFEVTEKPQPGVKHHEWFKLGLCPEFEIRREADSELARRYPSTTALPRVLGTECEKLVAAYLGFLKKRLDEVLGPAITTPREYIITVPAIWTHRGQDMTRQCAEKAGMGKSNELHVISEPEAASIYALQKMTNLGLKADDTFVLCDAGGGTVDLASFTIASLHPHTKLIGAGGGGSGGLCGSSFLNRLMEHHLREKMRSYAHWTDRWQKWAIDRFETYKSSFSNNFDQPFQVHLEGHHSPEHGISDGLLTIPTSVIRKEIFTPVVTKIRSLVRKQVDKTNQRGTQVKQVLMAGGFGRNPYLLRQLQDMLKDEGVTVTVIQQNNTAIVRGALIAGLAGQLGPREGFNVRVASRPASQHYGTQCWERYDSIKHPNAVHLKEPNPFGDGYQVFVNQWWVKKAETIEDGACRNFPFSYTEHTIRGLPHELPCTIFTCETDTAPRYPGRGQGIYELVTIKIPLDQTHQVNRKTMLRNGISLTTIDFKVEMRVSSASLEFTIILGEKQPQRMQVKTVRFESSNDVQ